jgi:hypothetical protein
MLIVCAHESNEQEYKTVHKRSQKLQPHSWKQNQYLEFSNGSGLRTSIYSNSNYC